MADVRLLIQEEGRSARNLIAFNVPVVSNNTEKVLRKPPSIPKISQPTPTKRCSKPTTRVRSASTGRDKKSELQARYWAFLFGNLQRAVDGIYQTCEEDESISECKEVILVLENYTRDFHNLIEWFKVKWAYESTQPPLRRVPLAWEVRKTSPGRAWGSSGTQKSISPVQRSSPTGSSCKSPVDQTIIEDKVIVTDIPAKVAANKDQESGLTRPGKDLRNTSESVLKNEVKSFKDKPKNLNEKVLEPVQNRGKSSPLKLIASKTPSKRTEVRSQNKSGAISESKIQAEMSNDCKIVPNTEGGKKSNTSNPIVDKLPLESNIKSKSSEGVIEANGEDILGGKNGRDVVKEARDGVSLKSDNIDDKVGGKHNASKVVPKSTKPVMPAYSTVSRMRPATAAPAQNLTETPKIVRSKTSVCMKRGSNVSRARPGTSVIVRKRLQPTSSSTTVQTQEFLRGDETKDLGGSVEVLTKQGSTVKVKDEKDGWQTVRSRYRRGSTHNLNMSTRFHKPSTAMSLPALSIESSPSDKSKKSCFTPDCGQRVKKRSINGKTGKNIINEVEKITKGDSKRLKTKYRGDDSEKKSSTSLDFSENESNSTLTIAAIFKNEAELLERRIQQFVEAQAERERVILEEEQKREEADSQRSQQLSDEEAFLQRQIQELESTEIDVDTETDETDGETVLETEGDEPLETLNDSTDDISLEDRYENMLEGMSWAERVDTLAQLQALVARHPGRALELHQKLSSPSRKRSLPETLRRYQAKQACAQRKRQILLMEKSQRLRELLNKVEDVKSAKNQLIEDKRIRMETKLKRAEENRTQHLLEIVRKAHDEDSKLKEIAFINELEAQNKRHDFMALCQEQEERLQGIQEERQRRQEEKAAKEAAAEERRRALEVERQLRIQKMRQVRREREERVGKMQLEREKERQELAREKARDREERLSALHAAQLANQEELQKKIAHKQQESARRHGENIEHIRQRAVESSILRCEEVPPTLRSYPAPKQCCLCMAAITNEVQLLTHLKSKAHLEAVRKMHDGREPPRDEMQRFNITQIRDVPTSSHTSNNANNNPANDTKAAKEKQKALKRRCRKMKQRMAARGQEWEDAQTAETGGPQTSVESANKAKFRRNLKELDRLCNNHGKTAWPSVAVAGLERCVGEISRAFNKYCASDQDAFNSLNGFATLTNLLNLGLNVQNTSHCLPNKSIVSVCKVYKAAVHGHLGNIETVLLGNKILVILDLLLQWLEAATGCDNNAHTPNHESNNNSTGSGQVATAAMQLISSLFVQEVISVQDKPLVHSRLQEVIGYLVAGGLVERVSRQSRSLIETDAFQDQDYEAPLMVASFELLSRVCYHLSRCSGQEHNAQGAEGGGPGEQTSARNHLLGSLAATEGAGAVGVLYAALVLPGHSLQKSSSPTPNQTTLSTPARNLALRALTLLRHFAEMDLAKMQEFLGAEATSLQFRLIASHLIGRMSRESHTAEKQDADGRLILSELFSVLGYFTVNNRENQTVLQSGAAGSSVLQQLCSLPFPFYGDPRLSSFTLPTLLAATQRNPEATAVLSCELSYQLLEEYRNSDEGKQNPLVRLLMRNEHVE
ncbi:S phase cyclin A-associated protein in the endoplasmic reticulum-like [Neodiprion fabricii]|uniref:S phase cyclin A-associated protein in the endoplasmic reticulum-like n=1 Tax=Neodiprion fabricii TaxID=2872261 RepID=UPI001ED92A4D|nr:S phase cyclin A-associated protein in the endoplasmic reticulum-like [Neodiprion fabricii]XP_046428517.1 S phase cyclin A-associated protein in the endoplasmic reticulum-like [Neodiprion fabricii]